MTVSIVVPIYNTEKYLRRCVDSLLLQSFHDIELILVDDGSTDGSGKICNEYAACDTRVRVIHKYNGGESSARNAGLFAATGEYLMFCDSDDEYLLNGIELLIGGIKQSGIDICVGAYLEITGGIKKMACTLQEQYTKNEIINKILTDSNPYGTGYIMSTVNGKIFKTSILRQYNISFNNNFVVGNDSLFVADYLNHSSNVQDVLSPVYIYYKYDVNERLQGMSWIYPDQYKLTITYYEKMLAMVQSKTTYFQKLFDVIVRQMVVAVVYKEYLSENLEMVLEFIVGSDLLQEAANVYQPMRLTDSVTIQQYFIKKDIKNLELELCEKAERYIETYGKQNNVRLMVIK